MFRKISNEQEIETILSEKGKALALDYFKTKYNYSFSDALDLVTILFNNIDIPYCLLKETLDAYYILLKLDKKNELKRTIAFLVNIYKLGNRAETLLKITQRQYASPNIMNKSGCTAMRDAFSLAKNKRDQRLEKNRGSKYSKVTQSEIKLNKYIKENQEDNQHKNLKAEKYHSSMFVGDRMKPPCLYKNRGVCLNYGMAVTSNQTR